MLTGRLIASSQRFAKSRNRIQSQRKTDEPFRSSQGNADPSRRRKVFAREQSVLPSTTSMTQSAAR
jgi:hypothetical protein